MFSELIWTWTAVVFCFCFPRILSNIPLNSPTVLTEWRQKSWSLWLQWKRIVTPHPLPPQDTSDQGGGLALLKKARLSLGEGRWWGRPPSPNCFRRKGLRRGGWRLNGSWDVHKRLGSELEAWRAWSTCFHACDPWWTYRVRSHGSHQPQSPLFMYRSRPFLDTHEACRAQPGLNTLPQPQTAPLPLPYKGRFSLGVPWCPCSVAQSCLIFCGPVDCSTPDFPALHHHPELA